MKNLSAETAPRIAHPRLPPSVHSQPLSKQLVKKKFLVHVTLNAFARSVCGWATVFPGSSVPHPDCGLGLGGNSSKSVHFFIFGDNSHLGIFRDFSEARPAASFFLLVSAGSGLSDSFVHSIPSPTFFVFFV